MARSQSPSDESNRRSPPGRSPSVSSSRGGVRRVSRTPSSRGRSPSEEGRRSVSRTPPSRGRSPLPLPSRALPIYDISPMRRNPPPIPGKRGYLVSPVRRTPSPKVKRHRYTLSPVHRSPPKRRRYDSPPPRHRPRDDHRQDEREKPKPCEVLGVFGLSNRTDEKDLRYEFSKYADVRYVKLVKDFDGRSRGFGFITFYDTKDATTAKEMLTGKMIDGVQPRIDYSITKHGGAGRHGFDRSPIRDQNSRRGGGSDRGSPLRKDMSPIRRRGSGDGRG